MQTEALMGIIYRLDNKPSQRVIYSRVIKLMLHSRVFVRKEQACWHGVVGE